MSHFEMKSLKFQKLILTGLLVGLPAIVQASISQCYLPEYSYRNWGSVESQNAHTDRVPASINRAAIMLTKPSKIFYGDDGEPISPELIANFNQIKASEKPWDPQEMIPLDMQPTNSASQVAAQVADRTATTLWNSPTIRESSIGHAATTVEETLKQEVVLGGGQPQSVQHKFNFNVQAFQTLAQIQYSGFTNAAIRYKITESKFAFELFEKITGNKDLVVSHTVGREDRLSAMSVRWTF